MYAIVRFAGFQYVVCEGEKVKVCRDWRPSRARA